MAELLPEPGGLRKSVVRPKRIVVSPYNDAGTGLRTPAVTSQVRAPRLESTSAGAWYPRVYSSFRRCLRARVKRFENTPRFGVTISNSILSPGLIIRKSLRAYVADLWCQGHR